MSFQPAAEGDCDGAEGGGRVEKRTDGRGGARNANAAASEDTGDDDDDDDELKIGLL